MTPLRLISFGYLHLPTDQEGRPIAPAADRVEGIRDLPPDPGRSITSIAKLLGVSQGTLYNHIPDLQQLRAGQATAVLERTTPQASP